MNWHDKAVNRIRELRPNNGADLVRLTEAIKSIQGAESRFKQLAKASSTEEILDVHAEFTFALVFMALRFTVELIVPEHVQRPDLAICRDRQTVCVEVKRFRPDELPDVLTLPDDGQDLPTYGNPQKTIKTIRDELLRKFAQINALTSIIAFWSDRYALEEVDVESAVKDVRSDARHGILRLPNDLLFCVFGSPYSTVGFQRHQLYCAPLKFFSQPYLAWVDDLENALVSDCIITAQSQLTGDR